MFTTENFIYAGKTLNSVLGALLGAVTPFCSCSTILVLVGLFKSGAPFNGAVSFLLTSPILNPAIITLMMAFFGLKATVIYTAFTFIFAIIMELVLDSAGFEKEIKMCLSKAVIMTVFHGKSCKEILGRNNGRLLRYP